MVLTPRLSRDSIVVDSCLGDTRQVNLQTLNYLSGGYTLAPKTLDEAMAICEMGAYVSPSWNDLIRRQITSSITTVIVSASSPTSTVSIVLLRRSRLSVLLRTLAQNVSSTLSSDNLSSS